MDWNIVYNPTLTEEEADFNGLCFDEWQETGEDRHSLYIDPLFVDPENGNFNLKAESPAIKLGFKPIDTLRVGPNGATGPG